MGAQLHIGTLRAHLQDNERSFDLTLRDLDIHAGDTVALTGASGSGKTLALELIGMLRAPGRSDFYKLSSANGDIDLARLWSKGARGQELALIRGQVFGFVPQTGGLAPFLNVRENISLAQRITHREDEDWVETLVERLGLSSVQTMWPADISIGQRQRTSIARALAHRPDFVIADEPTSALDPESADDVLRLFLDIAKELGCAVLLSSHDLERIGRFGLVRWHITTETDGPAVVATVAVTPC